MSGVGGEAGAAACRLALSSLGACIYYMASLNIDRTLLPLVDFKAYKVHGGGSGSGGDRRRCLVLDGTTIQNLEILTNSTNGGTKGSLLSLLDKYEFTCVLMHALTYALIHTLTYMCSYTHSHALAHALAHARHMHTHTTRACICIYTNSCRCTTPFGKRMFRAWVLHPLFDIPSLEGRLDAVEDLINTQDLIQV